MYIHIYIFNIYIYIYMCVCVCDYLKKLSIQINVVTDKGNSRNEM